MVDKILSPVGANELILKINEIIDDIPVDVSQLNNDAGYITGISSSDIETALGYVPYSASNPDGFISSAALSSLTDTSLSNLVNGQGLIYNSTTQKWENGTIATNISWGAITGTLADQTDLATALNNKQDTISGAASSITTSNLTGSRVLVSGTDGKVAASTITTTKLDYLTDVTSNIQAQLNNKQTSNLVTSINSSSTDTQYPSAKCVYDAIQAGGSTVDQTYNPASTNAQSGTAVAQALAGISSADIISALGYTPYDNTNPAGYITASALSGYEQTTNKVTSITSSSTDTQYPSAKAVYTATNANASEISSINSKIPSQATTSNQLADKAFVNSSISTNTANFIGTFQSVSELEAYTGTKTNNDYAFVETTDTAGNTFYDRYKYNGTSWVFEYELNNSSFTAAQWATINSGCTSTTASLAASALQSGDNISLLNNNAGYITGITSSMVTTALGYTPENTNNKVTSISASSTDTQYPSAKCVYDAIQEGGGGIEYAMVITDYTA